MQRHQTQTKMAAPQNAGVRKQGSLGLMRALAKRFTETEQVGLVLPAQRIGVHTHTHTHTHAHTHTRTHTQTDPGLSAEPVAERFSEAVSVRR